MTNPSCYTWGYPRSRSEGKSFSGYLRHLHLHIYRSFVFRSTGTTTSGGTGVTFTGSTAGRVITMVAQGVVGRTGTQAPRINVYVNR